MNEHDYRVFAPLIHEQRRVHRMKIEAALDEIDKCYVRWHWHAKRPIVPHAPRIPPEVVATAEYDQIRDVAPHESVYNAFPCAFGELFSLFFINIYVIDKWLKTQIYLFV